MNEHRGWVFPDLSKQTWPLRIDFGGNNFISFWLSWRGVILQGKLGRFRWFKRIAWNPATTTSEPSA